jgi:hypothetical protein
MQEILQHRSARGFRCALRGGAASHLTVASLGAQRQDCSASNAYQGAGHLAAGYWLAQQQAAHCNRQWGDRDEEVGVHKTRVLQVHWQDAGVDAKTPSIQMKGSQTASYNPDLLAWMQCLHASP